MLQLILRNIGYWYINTIFDRGVTATMASAPDTRAAFMQGKDLPPEDKVSHKMHAF